MLTVHDLPYKDKIEMMSLKELLPRDFKTTVSLYESEWIENLEKFGIDVNDKAYSLEVSKKNIIDLRKKLFSDTMNFSNEYKDEIYRFTERLMNASVNAIYDFRENLDYIEDSYQKIYKFFLIYGIEKASTFLSFVREYLIYTSQAVDFMTKFKIRSAMSNSTIDHNYNSDMNIHPLRELVKGSFSNNEELAKTSQKLLSKYLGTVREYKVFDDCKGCEPSGYIKDIFDYKSNEDRESLFDMKTKTGVLGPKISDDYYDGLTKIKIIDKTKDKLREELKDEPNFELNEDWLVYLIKQAKVPLSCIRTENGASYVMSIDNKKFLLFIYKNELRGIDLLGFNSLIIIEKDPNGEYKFDESKLF